MTNRTSTDTPNLKKSRSRELAILLVALLIACAVGLAVRSGMIDPAGSRQSDIVAK